MESVNSFISMFKDTLKAFKEDGDVERFKGEVSFEKYGIKDSALEGLEAYKTITLGGEDLTVNLSAPKSTIEFSEMIELLKTSEDPLQVFLEYCRDEVKFEYICRTHLEGLQVAQNARHLMAHYLGENGTFRSSDAVTKARFRSEMSIRLNRSLPEKVHEGIRIPFYDRTQVPVYNTDIMVWEQELEDAKEKYLQLLRTVVQKSDGQAMVPDMLALCERDLGEHKAEAIRLSIEISRHARNVHPKFSPAKDRPRLAQRLSECYGFEAKLEGTLIELRAELEAELDLHMLVDRQIPLAMLKGSTWGGTNAPVDDSNARKVSYLIEDRLKELDVHLMPLQRLRQMRQKTIKLRDRSDDEEIKDLANILIGRLQISQVTFCTNLN